MGLRAVSVIKRVRGTAFLDTSMSSTDN